MNLVAYLHLLLLFIAKSCPTLWDPMDYSMPGFPVLHYLPDRVCSNSCPLSWWCHLTISSSVTPFSCPQSFPASGSFPVSWLFASGGQSIAAFASASDLRYWILNKGTKMQENFRIRYIAMAAETKKVLCCLRLGFSYSFCYLSSSLGSCWLFQAFSSSLSLILLALDSLLINSFLLLKIMSFFLLHAVTWRIVIFFLKEACLKLMHFIYFAFHKWSISL